MKRFVCKLIGHDWYISNAGVPDDLFPDDYELQVEFRCQRCGKEITSPALRHGDQWSLSRGWHTGKHGNTKTVD